MRYHTKEYYELLMSLDAAACYEPTIDKEVYTEEDIAELYQEAMDRYIEEERAEYDAPPEYIFDIDDLEDFDPEDIAIAVPGLADDEGDDLLIPVDPADREKLKKLCDRIYALEVEEFEKREPFDEEEAKEEFEEMYRDNLEEPDEDLPDWVRESVDPRILAMYLMPEKIYRKLSAEDDANQERFDALDEAADEALDAQRESLPEEYQEFLDILEELEDSTVVSIGMKKGSSGASAGRMEIELEGWDEEGNEVPRLLSFTKPEIIEDEGVEVRSWEDEDGDTDSDCELLYCELYKENDRPEIHMLFDNNGLKYLTLRCDKAHADLDEDGGTAAIGK